MRLIRTFLLVAVVCFALGFGYPTAHAAPQSVSDRDPILDQLTSVVETTILPKLYAYQNNYRAQHGRNFQGLPTHAQPTRDGAPTRADGLSKRPTDQNDDWSGFMAHAGLSDRLPFQLTVDVYSGPAGDGYTLTAAVERARVVWRKVWNVGAEDWREMDWTADP